VRWSPEQIAGWLPLAYPGDAVMRCRTRRSTCQCSSRAGGRCAASSSAAANRAGDALPAGQASPPKAAASCATPPYQPATPRGGRPGGARPLGRRPGSWQAAQRGRDLGRAPQPLCAVVPAPRRVHRRAHAPGADRRRAGAARAVAPLPHLGSRQGDGRAHPVHHRLRRPGLLLRPAQPWQRGTNENTNGLLRQYLAKGADLCQLDQAALDAIAAELNGRPRQTLGFKTPSQVLAEALR
jgi:hypothetical protein